MERLFVYGTLMEPDVQQRVIGRVVAGHADTLDGYGKRDIVIDGNTYFIARLDSASSIPGLILDLTPEELARTDAYEGDEYRRVRVTLRGGAETWVYAE